MSGELILPNSPTQRQLARRGKMNATIDEVFTIVGNMVGPLAVIVEEQAEKIARLEDKLGITDATIVGEAQPVGTPYTGPVPNAPDIVPGPQFTPTGAGGDCD